MNNVWNKLCRCLTTNKQVDDEETQYFDEVTLSVRPRSVSRRESRAIRAELQELTIKRQMLEAANIEIATYKRVLRKKNELIKNAAEELNRKDEIIEDLVSKLYGNEVHV